MEAHPELMAKPPRAAHAMVPAANLNTRFIRSRPQKEPQAPTDPGVTTGCTAKPVVACGADEDDVSKTMRPAAKPMPPTTKPTVETVASVWSASMSFCAVGGQSLLTLHVSSSEDFLLSAITPKIDPTTTPAPPTPSAT